MTSSLIKDPMASLYSLAKAAEVLTRFHEQSQEII
jgi:hypothetical protein